MDPETINNLIDLGTAGVIIVLMITGFLVPKPFYERETKRGDTATESSSKTADALRDVAGALRVVTDEVKGLRVELDKATVETREVKEEVKGLKTELSEVRTLKSELSSALKELKMVKDELIRSLKR